MPRPSILKQSTDTKNSSPAGSQPFRYVEVCQRQSSASLCEYQLRKVRVDCSFLLSRTKWGEMDGKDSGLMYLDLTFQQPSDCKLANATITMTFHQLTRYRFSDMEVTEFFGPQILTGEKKERHITNTFEATPKIGAGNATVEGIGGSRTSEATFASRWKFTGSRFVGDQSAANRGRQYRQLVWHLEENELERQAIHNSVIHTALAFHHDDEPFYVDLEIKAKLQRWHHRFKQHLLCPPPGRKACTRAKIEPMMSQKDPFLEQMAKGLNQAMTEANLHPVPEVSDPKPMEPVKEEMESTNDRFLPNDALLALAQQLTGQKTEIAASQPDSNTGVDKSTEDQNEPSTPPHSITAPSNTKAEEKLVMNTAMVQVSQFLAALVASLIVGLSKLHGDLAGVGNGPKSI